MRRSRQEYACSNLYGGAGKGRSLMQPWPQLARAALFAAAYLVFAEVGHLLSFRQSAFATFWPPSGLYLVAVLATERRHWPWLLSGGLAANLASDVLLHDKVLLVSMAFAFGNALEAFAGAWLILRIAGTSMVLERVNNVLKFAVLSALLSTTLSATVGATTVVAGLDKVDWGSVWFVWWSADAAGILIVAPALLALVDARFLKRLCAAPWRVIEFGFVLLSLIGMTIYVFGLPSASLAARPVVLLPLLLWSALRFGPQGSALAVLGPSLVMAWNTVEGVGPFAPLGATAAHQAIALQIALCVMSLSTLLLAAIVAERRDAQEALQKSEKHLRQTNAELELLREKLTRQSLVDSLTDLANRRAIDGKLAAEFAHWQRQHRPFSIVMVDIDHFKAFNDSLGHVEGDRCLQTLAGTFARITRPGDLVGRWGGEEFMTILPETNASGARAFCSRLLNAVADLRIAHPASDIGRFVTVSAGIATYQGEPGLASSDIVEAADRALYRAKRAGRNRTEAASFVGPQSRAQV